MTQAHSTSYHCTLCPHLATSISMALSHMHRSHGIIPDINRYTCARCRAPFETPAEAQDHVQDAHLRTATAR